MLIIMNEDAQVTVGVTPDGSNSLHLEISENRDTIEHIYLHESKLVKISFGPDGLRLDI